MRWRYPVATVIAMAGAWFIPSGDILRGWATVACILVLFFLATWQDPPHSA